jgi:hypothetical protein
MYTNTFHFKALENILKLRFLVRKYVYHLAILIKTSPTLIRVGG